MIFVTVGTNEARFDRLLQALTTLDLPDEEIVIQHGHSSPIGPAAAKIVAFLPFDEMATTMRDARCVVTHAGVGSIMVALANGKRPVVVPRLAAFGEAVDDHQLQLARRFGAAGLVTAIDSPELLADELTRDQSDAVIIPSSSTLATDLREYLERAFARHTGLASA